MAKNERPYYDLDRPMGRALAWLHFTLKDHHLLRVWWWNLHQIAPGVWRSNQPSPRRLARYRDLGITSVVSLRGRQPDSFNLFEAEACATLGLSFVHAPGITARKLPQADRMLGVIDKIAAQTRPLVFHCKSGADRTGMVAALVLILVEGQPVAQAAQQLAVRHIHFPRSKSGVLGHVFRVYLRDAEPHGQGFRDWIENGYNPDAITEDFNDWRKRAGRWAA